jgi:hypothetical protein
MGQAGKRHGWIGTGQARAAVARFRHPDLAGIYLNDHLAGATAGADLAGRLAKALRGRDGGADLARIAAEIEADRDALRGLMAHLGIPVQRYKVWAGWLGEKAGRAKLNGYLLSRSPASDLLELEALRLGVEGKAALWRSLHILAAADGRLDGARLVDLIARAKRQSATLEEVRSRAASRVLRDGLNGAPGPPTIRVRG